MFEITTTAAERSRLREAMGPLFTILENTDKDLHDLYSEYFEHSETSKQAPIPAYQAEYIARRLFTIEAILAEAVRDYHSMAGTFEYNGMEYEEKRAARLLEIREAEKLATAAFIKIEAMGTGREKLMEELRRAEALPDAEAIPILKGILA